MKKRIVFMLTLIMALSLAACGNSTGSGEKDGSTSDAASESDIAYV